jgi:hypothetical protein
MAATIHLMVWRSTDAATLAGSTVDISFMSVDSTGNPILEDAACRITNAITIPAAACAYSFSKALSACLSTAPATYVKNFEIWGAFPAQTPPAGTCVLYGTAACGAGNTPVDTLLCTTDLNDATSDAKATWDAASYAAAGCSTGYLDLQLQVANTACVGVWGGANGCALNYSYDEA